MFTRRTAAILAAGTLAAMVQAAPALAGDMPGADMANGPMAAPPPMPDAPPPPRLPDPRPIWHNDSPPAMTAAPAVLQVDPRARSVWLAECGRRMDAYYRGGWQGRHGWKRRHRDDEGRSIGNEYCEVYFDDYYRYYAQAGVAYGHGCGGCTPMPRMMMRTVNRPAPAAQNCVEEETVRYEPVRTRIIPRRRAPIKRVPDKRIPDKRIRIQ